MARFTLEGDWGGKPLTLIWQDGEAFGPEAAVGIVQKLAALNEGRRIALPGCPSTHHDHLKSPYSARALMDRVFTTLPTQHGDLPPLPDVPEGAIR